MTELDDPPADMIVKGPNQMTAMPIDVHVTYTEIAHCLDKSISKIETAITNALEHTPPELYADIYKKVSGLPVAVLVAWIGQKVV